MGIRFKFRLQNWIRYGITTLCSLPIWLVSLPYSNKPRKAHPILRITILLESKIGDTLLFLPFLETLRQQFPTARITLVLEDYVRIVAPLIPQVDEIEYDTPPAGNIPKRFQTLVPRLNRLKPDLLVCPQSRFDSLVALYLALTVVKVPVAIGYRYYGLSSPRMTRLLKNTSLSDHSMYRSRHYLALNESLQDLFNLPETAKISIAPVVSVSEADRKRAHIFLSQLEPSVRGPRIFIHNLSNPRNIKKVTRLSLAFWQQLIQVISNAYPTANFYFIEAPEEQTELNQMLLSIQQAAPQARLFNLIELNISFAQLAPLFSVGDLFIGSDSGPMHLAVATGLQTIGLFGATNPAWFLPPVPFCHPVINPEPACRPCFWITRQEMCASPVCLNIGIGPVFTEVSAILRTAQFEPRQY